MKTENSRYNRQGIFTQLKKYINRHSIKLVALLAFLMLLSACAQSSSNEGAGEKHIHFLFNVSTNSLDPHVDMTYIPVRAGITETLVRVDEENVTIAPWLAESWDSTDGQHWTIKLREDVTFQNGKEMDAEAVKASLERALDESVAIENALKIDEIEADGYTLHITTKEPFPEFISELVNPNVSIIDVTEEDFTNHPVGTGPFALESFTPGSKLELVRYDEYWDGASKLDSVTFSFNEDASARSLALESGQTDIVYRPEVESIETLQANEGIMVEATETFRTHNLTMNLDRDSLKDVNVRRAVDVLLDRQEIVDTIMLGYAEVADGPFNPTLPFAPSYEEKETGTEIAIEYLEEAGYTLENGQMQKDGEPLHFTVLTYGSRAELPLIAQVFQSNAKQIGIEVEIRQIEVPEEYMASNRDWDLITYSNVTSPRGDAGYYLNATYHPTGALNFGSVNDPELTGIIDELNRTVDQDVRAKLTEQAAAYIDEQKIHSFLIHPSAVVAYDENKVKNWVTTRSEYYMITNQLDVN